MPTRSKIPPRVTRFFLYIEKRDELLKAAGSLERILIQCLLERLEPLELGITESSIQNEREYEHL